MKLHVHVASGKEREEGLALSLTKGLARFGDTIATSPVDKFRKPDPEADIGAVFGLKGHSRWIMEAYRAAGKHTIMFDKALIRVPGSALKQLRVCLNDDTPLRYLMRHHRSFERWERFKIDLRPRRESGSRDAIVLALSSQKYCDYFGLGDATAYATRVAADIRAVTRKRSIIYRPKPSWHDFQPVDGTILSRPPEGLGTLLESAHVLVTHGSSAAIDALIYGVPAICLGRSAASPVSGNSLDTIHAPHFPSDLARWQWLCNLAWCQWSVEELQSGEAWGFIREEIRSL